MTDTSFYYDEQAVLAQQEASAATLENVRERALRSAERWRILSVQARKVEIERAKRELPANPC